MVSNTPSSNSVAIWRRATMTCTDHIRTDVLGADLHDAWFLTLGGGQDRTEVQIVSKYHVIVRGGEGHDFRIRRVVRAQL
jgi:hypothetical protein